MKRVTKQELLDALENLTVRFPLEQDTRLANVQISQRAHCKCMQFEDCSTCRHVHALEVVERAKLR